MSHSRRSLGDERTGRQAGLSPSLQIERASTRPAADSARLLAASCALRAPGQQVVRATRRTRGFTLIEMIVVLMIIAILAGASIPAFNSAINEHHVREDGHQLAMMVRTAMIRSAEQHRPYIIELTKTTMALHPLGEAAKSDADTDAALFKDSGSTSTNADHPVADAVTMDAEAQHQLDDEDKLQIPDVTKTNAWTDPPNDGIQWVFRPGELCAASKVRIVRGDAYLELNFAALTGDLDGEKSYFP